MLHRRAALEHSRRPARTASVALVMVLLSTVAARAGTLTEHMEIACIQAPVAALNCDYRLLDGGSLEAGIAEVDSLTVTGTRSNQYPAADDTTAILLLVDTSDPARQPVIDRIIEQINSLLNAARPHHRFGLATFDTDLYLVASIGTRPDELRRALGSLAAKGRTTELYRNVREAVRLLGRETAASRRALLVLSDGLAEDYAYHHADVVRLAREENVIIHSIGYPRSVAQSVALQTIRRLSDETGGQYAQANHLDYSLPSGTFTRMFAATDSGGSLNFDLQPLIDQGISGARDLSLALQTSEHSFIVLAPVQLPGNALEATAPAAQAPAASRPPEARRPAVVAPPAEPVWPWFVAVFFLLLIALAIVLIALRRVRETIAETPDGAAASALAYLVMDDGQETRHVIDKLPWRIGRGRSCDLTLADHSVSRLHAEIRHNEDGQLLLRDLESLNGVFVNDNRIDSIQLREGDSVDIGDVRMHFTLHDESYESQEPTVLVRTHAP